MHKFLKRRMQHQLLYGWVTCAKHFLPSVSLERVIKGFHQRYKLNSETSDINASIKEFERMCSEENEIKKEE